VGGNACEDGTTCISADPAEAGVCLRQGAGTLRRRCQTGADCAGAICVPFDSQSGYCSSLCDFASGCPDATMACSPLSATTGLCLLRGPGPVGSPCSRDEECAGAVCMNHPDYGKMCTRTCTKNTDCPLMLFSLNPVACIDAGNGIHVCDPAPCREAGLCDDSAGL
jgi:hypothetical protein